MEQAFLEPLIQQGKGGGGHARFPPLTLALLNRVGFAERYIG